MAGILFLSPQALPGAHAQSRCHGTVENGSIEQSVALPARGPNYVRMSQGPISATRVYVHSLVRDITLAAYAALEAEYPRVQFVYGESGLAHGGPIAPHKTHQNGLSVDFFVPVLNERGETVPFPARLENQFGYGIDFNAQAEYGNLRIDFPALAEHIHQLHQAARARGADLALVVFDTQYLPRLFDTPRGPYLREKIPFMKTPPWVRHDEHIHVDFAVACP